MHQNVVNIRAELDTRKEVEDELVGGELESFEPINVDVLVRVYDPKCRCCKRASNEGLRRLRKVLTIMEKAPTRAFLWLKAPISAFTFTMRKVTPE